MGLFDCKFVCQSLQQFNKNLQIFKDQQNVVTLRERRMERLVLFLSLLGIIVIQISGHLLVFM